MSKELEEFEKHLEEKIAYWKERGYETPTGGCCKKGTGAYQEYQMISTPLKTLR